MRKINVGQKVINSEGTIIGTASRFYTPTSCAEQTVVKTNDGREYHAPTSEWKPYQYGTSAKTIIIDELPVVPLDNKVTTMVIPNKDTYMGNYTFCSREALQKAYLDKVGSTIDFCGKPMLVKEVKITDESISIILGDGVI